MNKIVSVRIIQFGHNSSRIMAPKKMPELKNIKKIATLVIIFKNIIFFTIDIMGEAEKVEKYNILVSNCYTIP